MPSIAHPPINEAGVFAMTATDGQLDITQLPDLAEGTGRVGAVRTRRPVYVDLLPPCNNACPAGENIQEWLRLIKEDRKSVV